MTDRVWIPVADADAWALATTVDVRDGDLVTLRRDGTDHTVQMTRAELEALPAAVLDEAVDDLTALSSVHDATMLDTLRRRHAADEIFTSIGEVVISVNPFKPVPSCTPDSIARLSQQGEAAPPHVARVASVAYRKMTGDDGSPPRAQSILISGESGAGKTESCKLCLMALASVSGSSQGATEGAVESALLLEAFGNAKTVYNDNSSRFGKWTAVFFDASRRIVACHAEAFLLEKPRVVGTGPGERSYHIFYQMLAGANEEERRELSLQSSCSAYAYLRGGTDAISGVDDAAQWRETAARMSLLGIGGERRGELMRVIAAVLAIGNIGFTAADDGTRCVSGEGGRWLAHAASLLRVSPSQLAEKLTSRVLTAGGKGRSSMYTVALDAEACEAARDALAQSLYAAAFESLVESLNGSQEEAAAAAGRVRGCATVDNERFVGLLDIFGFENFALNSFEQLCINFANERLQAHFIDALVKLRVLEYEREGVPLTAIEFPDNEAQLALLDGKAVGLFASLDDEGSVPGGSEQGYVDGLVARFGSNGACASEAFDPLKRGKGGTQVGERTGRSFAAQGSRLDRLSFCVVHFAEPVRYSAEGWLAKNVSGLHPDLAFVLNQSESPLVRGMYPSSTADATAKRPSVGAAFRKSLRSLSTVMLQTTQSFLRCVKPNGHKAADTFDGRFVMRQLHYTGVAAVVAIQRAGYPVSMAHADFVGRYRCLVIGHAARLEGGRIDPDCSKACTGLLRIAPALTSAGEDDWLGSLRAVVGASKVYLIEAVSRALEASRQRQVAGAALFVQRCGRGQLVRATVRVLRMHWPVATTVRAALAATDVETARRLLAPLAAGWAAAKLPLRSTPSQLLECRADFDSLRGEVRALEDGLEAETEALEELGLALRQATSGKVSPKEAYVAIKLALSAAAAASRGLRPELAALIEEAESALASCQGDLEQLAGRLGGADPDGGDDELDAAAQLAAMEAELAAEVSRQEARRKEERRARRREVADELLASALEEGSSVAILTVQLRNGVDTESSSAARLVGFSEGGCGVAFSETNAVAAIHRGGQAMRDGALRLGDVVLEVDGAGLDGEHVVTALRAREQPSYELTVARLSEDARGDDGGAGTKRAGWVHSIRARGGKALPGTTPRRLWAVLDSTSLAFKTSPHELTLKQCTVGLSGVACKVPVTRLAGKSLAMPPALASMAERQRFPFSLAWERGEVGYDLILGVATSGDRQAWAKAIQAVRAEIQAQAPTAGWLTKKPGRRGLRPGESLLRPITGWKRRWFVLHQGDPSGGVAPSLRYFSRPEETTASLLGAVVLNAGSVLSVGASAVPHSFEVRSQGAADLRPITTVLACRDKDDCERWLKALRRALLHAGSEVASSKELMAAAERQSHLLASRSAQALMALSRLEQEELRRVRLRTLYEVAALLRVRLPPELEPAATRGLKAISRENARERLVALIHAAQVERDAMDRRRAVSVAYSVRGRARSTWHDVGGGMGVAEMLSSEV